MHVALAGLFVLASIAAPPDADRITMIPVIVGDQSDISTSLVAAAVGEAARERPGLTLISLDERYAREDPARTASMLACGGDTKCIARALASDDADLFLVIIVNEELDPPLLGLILAGSEDHNVVAEAYAEVARGAEPLRAAVVARTAKMLEGLGYSRSAKISVLVTPSQAVLELAGGIEPDAGTGSVFSVRGGKYEIFARLPGYREERREVSVAAGEHISVQLTLAEEEGTSPWIWAGAIAALVAIGIGVGAAVAAGGEDTCLCVVTGDASSCGRCQ